MSQLLFLQLLVAFFVGGLVVALLGIIAERASEKTAGIIISFPTTLALGFFFVGWATSPEEVVEMSSVVPAVEGVLMIFTLVYLYLSKVKLGKVASILLCTSGGLLTWLVLVLPIAIFELKNLWISLLVYLVFTGIAYFFITAKSHVSSTKTALHYSHMEKLGRAIFSGFIIALAVFLSKTLGPIWGVAFSAFPAVYISTMTIVSWHYDSAYLFRVWKNSPAGSVVFVIYALSAMVTFPAFGLLGGTIASYLLSGIAMMLLITRCSPRSIFGSK